MENRLSQMLYESGSSMFFFLLIILVMVASFSLISLCENQKGQFRQSFNLGQIDEIRFIPGGYTEIKINNNTYTFAEYNNLTIGQTVFLKKYQHKFCISDSENELSNDRLIIKINDVSNHDTFCSFFANVIKI